MTRSIAHSPDEIVGWFSRRREERRVQTPSDASMALNKSSQSQHVCCVHPPWLGQNLLGSLFRGVLCFLLNGVWWAAPASGDRTVVSRLSRAGSPFVFTGCLSSGISEVGVRSRESPLLQQWAGMKRGLFRLTPYTGFGNRTLPLENR